MRLIESLDEMKSLTRELHSLGKTIGFVPTMGYLHEGHLTLMREAKMKTGFVVTSIFVNPLQFGVGEDFAEYPRDLTRDINLAEEAGVDIVFAPKVKDMYPNGYSTFIDVENLTDKLCGKSRPGHFRGVTTVVAKLFNIVQPDIAFFGQKDAQQVLVLQKMVQDLNMNLDIDVVPIVREQDGLAMSSRNVYLNPDERQAALSLSKSLKKAAELVKAGERDPLVIKRGLTGLINQESLAQIDYVEIYKLPHLVETNRLEDKNLIALAVFIGKTRLIDNVIVEG